MSKKEQSIAVDFETTQLLVLNSSETTLPVDTSAEWTKGFVLINKLIKMLADSTYMEEFEDNNGKKREKPVFHPQLLGYIQERRHMIDQIWKISGGEVINEGKKEAIKSMARALFEAQQDRDFKEKYKKDVIQIIEVEKQNEN